MLVPQVQQTIKSRPTNVIIIISLFPLLNNKKLETTCESTLTQMPCIWEGNQKVIEDSTNLQVHSCHQTIVAPPAALLPSIHHTPTAVQIVFSGTTNPSPSNRRVLCHMPIHPLLLVLRCTWHPHLLYDLNCKCSTTQENETEKVTQMSTMQKNETEKVTMKENNSVCETKYPKSCFGSTFELPWVFLLACM